MIRNFLMLLVFSLLFHSSIVYGNTANENVTAQIIDFGFYELAGQSIVVNSREAATGKRRYNSKPVFLEKATNIPAILGYSFGFRYKVYGMPVNSLVELKKVLKYPELKGKSSSSSKLICMTDSEGSIEKATGYTFDEEFELVPGIWTFEIWYNEKLLVTKSFNIIAQI